MKQKDTKLSEKKYLKLNKNIILQIGELETH